MEDGIRVYLAGPITLGDRTENFRNFCRWQKWLMEQGFAVLNPGLSMLHPDAWNIPHESWMVSCLPWLEWAECVIRLPGESRGADAEVARAESLEIPVFYASDFAPMGIFLEWAYRQGLTGKKPSKDASVKEDHGKDAAKAEGGKEAPRPFEIGDRVRVLDVPASEHNRSPGFVKEMVALIGKDGIVVGYSEPFTGPRYRVAIKGGQYHYRPEWLELVQEPKPYPHADDVCDSASWPEESAPVKPVESSSVLDEAKAAVTGDRQASYGPPDQDFARTAGMWSALFADLLRDGVRFEPFHVAQAMILLKMSRQRHQRKRDNWVDAAGYAHCGAVCDEVAKPVG